MSQSDASRGEAMRDDADRDGAFAEGSMAAATGILLYLHSIGAEATADRVRRAWEDGTIEDMLAAHARVDFAGAGAPVPAPRLAETLLGPPSLSRAQAVEHGFTGDACGRCQSLRMVRTGTCTTCQDCSATTGCS